MAKKRDLLTRMADNPAGDWSISDVEKLCRTEGMTLTPPSSGSHYLVTSPYLHGQVTVPYKRPIKKRYIKQLVSYTGAHRGLLERKSDG